MKPDIDEKTRKEFRTAILRLQSHYGYAHLYAAIYDLRIATIETNQSFHRALEREIVALVKRLDGT